MTDPKMKRGHNFGVVYVTNSNIEEEAIHQAKKKDPIAKATDTTVDIKKKRNLEIEVPRRYSAWQALSHLYFDNKKLVSSFKEDL